MLANTPLQTSGTRSSSMCQYVSRNSYAKQYSDDKKVLQWYWAQIEPPSRSKLQSHVSCTCTIPLRARPGLVIFKFLVVHFSWSCTVRTTDSLWAKANHGRETSLPRRVREHVIFQQRNNMLLTIRTRMDERLPKHMSTDTKVGQICHTWCKMPESCLSLYGIAEKQNHWSLLGGFGIVTPYFQEQDGNLHSAAMLRKTSIHYWLLAHVRTSWS